MIRRSSAVTIAPLAVACALATSSLYWAQSVVGQAATEFGPSLSIPVAPSATLLGYALGVAGLASFSRDLSAPRGLLAHGACLAVALCLAAASPNGACLALACLATGAGSALTQRLLVTATTLVPKAGHPQAIGTIISAGLLGIVFARAFVAEAALAVGWRTMFLLDAAAVLAVCAVSAWLGGNRAGAPALRPDLPSPLSLLRSIPPLRSAAMQQAMAFAAFNLGWSIFPGSSHASSTARAMIATSGAAAALLSGRACRLWVPRRVALVGLSGIGGAAALAALAMAVHLPAAGPAAYAAMALLEVGTQVALVANQARAQAAAGSVPVRGRLAAIMTTIAFGGGAVGSAVGNAVLR